MRDEWGNIDISEYLAKLPDKGKCLTRGGEGVQYVNGAYTWDPGTDFYDRYAYSEPDRPYLVGGGPVECSTCTDVAVLNEIVWDTNSYYRKLGFAFPYRPTKRQLREAFTEHDGPNNAWLMMAFKNLINDVMRRLYDATPLGQFFLDADWQERLKQKAIKEAVRRRQAWLDDGIDDEIDAKDVLDEWGLKVDQPQDDRYGDQQSTPEDGSKPSAPRRTIPWSYAYYLWRSTEYDTERLGRWQQLLVSAFAQRKVQRKFSVGYFGKQPHRCLSSIVDGRQVLFLNENEWPDEELAAHMVMQVLLDEKRALIGARRDGHPQLQSGR